MWRVFCSNVNYLTLLAFSFFITVYWCGPAFLPFSAQSCLVSALWFCHSITGPAHSTLFGLRIFFGWWRQLSSLLSAFQFFWGGALAPLVYPLHCFWPFCPELREMGSSHINVGGYRRIGVYETIVSLPSLYIEASASSSVSCLCSPKIQSDRQPFVYMVRRLTAGSSAGSFAILAKARNALWQSWNF